MNRRRVWHNVVVCTQAQSVRCHWLCHNIFGGEGGRPDRMGNSDTDSLGLLRDFEGQPPASPAAPTSCMPG